MRQNSGYYSVNFYPIWTKICLRTVHEVPNVQTIVHFLIRGLWNEILALKNFFFKKTPFSAPKIVILTNFSIFPGKTPVGISS